MSGPGDDRWRGGRPYDQNRQSGQRSTASGPRDRTTGSQRGGQNNFASNNWGGGPREQFPAGPPLEQHVPVRGFNATESKGALTRNPAEPKPFVYKPTGKDVNLPRPSGPWGSKPNTMANGKDFFLELRKQVTTLRQGG